MKSLIRNTRMLAVFTAVLAILQPSFCRGENLANAVRRAGHDEYHRWGRNQPDHNNYFQERQWRERSLRRRGLAHRDAFAD